jgi:hypothetical protein
VQSQLKAAGLSAVPVLTVSKARVIISDKFSVWITNKINPRSRVLPENLIENLLVKKFRALYGTQNIISLLAEARHWPLS